MAMKKSSVRRHPFSARFGARLREIRKSRNMTQEEFGQLLGVSKQVLSRYERGQRCPPLVTAWGFSQKLGVPLGEMVDMTPPDAGT